MFYRYGDQKPAEHLKKSCWDQATLDGHTARWPPGAAHWSREQNLKSPAHIFIMLNHNKPTTDLNFELLTPRLKTSWKYICDSTTVVFRRSQLSVIYFLLRHCFLLLVRNAFWDISWPEYAQVSYDASWVKWEDQVTSGYFDRALREADFELEHVLGLRLMTFHEYTRTQVQRSTHKNADWQTPSSLSWTVT